MKKLLLLIYLMGCLLPIACKKDLALDDRLSKIQKEKVVRVGMDVSTGLPFIQKKGELESYGGFEYDIAKYISGKIGANIKLVPLAWDQLLESLEKGKIDMAINAIERPPANMPKSKMGLAFSNSYYVSFQQLVVASKDNFTYNLSDLSHQKVGVMTASAGHAMLKELNKVKNAGIQIVPFSEPDTMFKELMAGKLKAIFTERAVASWFSWKHEEIKLTGDEILKRPFVVAVDADEIRLLKKVDAILAKARQDPEFKQIFKKWHIRYEK